MAPCGRPFRKTAGQYSSVVTTQPILTAQGAILTPQEGRASQGRVRLTQYAHGGGCACKIPPGELEQAVARLIPARKPADLLIGVEHGDDAAVSR